MTSEKKHSIFKDIAQIGGGEVNPMSKNSAKRDTRPLKGMLNSTIFFQMGGDPRNENLILGGDANDYSFFHLFV